MNVTSILSDPNVDPHEYTSNVQTAQSISQAQLVVENGLGYDDWMDKLLSASPDANRIVLVGGDIADHKLPDNPHVWYGVNNMPAITQAIVDALKKLDPPIRRRLMLIWPRSRVRWRRCSRRSTRSTLRIRGRR